MANYLFLTDDSFSYHQPRQYNYTTERYATMDDQLANYFHQHQIWSDPRTRRLNTALAPFSGRPLAGQLQLHLDPTYLTANLEVMAPTTGGDASYLRDFFNICETVYTGLRALTGSYVPMPQTELDTLLTKYTSYVQGSLQLSSELTAAKLVVSELRVNEDVTATVEIPEQTLLLQWFRFQFKLDDALTEWYCYLDPAAFKRQYPYTTITQIIPPCAPVMLLNLTADTGANYVQAQLGDASSAASIRQQDHSGYATYTVDYYRNSLTGSSSTPPLQITFGALYQGRVPSTSEVCQAIRAFLKAQPELAQVTDDTWLELMPALFASGVFYLLPDYDNYVVDSTYGSYLYRNLSNHRLLAQQVLGRLSLTAEQQRYCDDYGVILQDPGTKGFLYGFPDSNNDSTAVDLVSLFPDYQARTSTDPKYLEISLASRTLGNRLAEMLPLAIGLHTSTIYQTQTIWGLQWYNFIVRNQRTCYVFYLLTKRSYRLL